MYGQKIQQLFFRTDGLQERITDYLGLFSFVLHFKYYSTELEIFFFVHCPSLWQKLFSSTKHF